MKFLRPIVSSSVLVSLLAACSGTMGSGATPPLSAPGAPLNAQGNMTAPLSSPAATKPNQLVADAMLTVLTPGVVALPNAAGFSGTVCIGPATTTAISCPSPEASATPSAAPTVAQPSPKSVLITPPPKMSATGVLHLVFTAYPTSAPQRDDDAEDGATSALAMLDLTPSTELAVNGLDAFTFVLPKDQASSEHHYALVLFDRDQKASHGGSLFQHHKATLHGGAIGVSAKLTGTTLQFVDNSTLLPLVGKHHYTLVLYSDTVTPTAAPSAAPSAVPTATATATGSASPSATGSPASESTAPAESSLPTPYVTYPTSNSAPLNAATPMGTATP